jgi:hypothetical protein
VIKPLIFIVLSLLVSLALVPGCVRKTAPLDASTGQARSLMAMQDMHDDLQLPEAPGADDAVLGARPVARPVAPVSLRVAVAIMDTLPGWLPKASWDEYGLHRTNRAVARGVPLDTLLSGAAVREDTRLEASSGSSCRVQSLRRESWRNHTGDTEIDRWRSFDAGLSGHLVAVPVDAGSLFVDAHVKFTDLTSWTLRDPLGTGPIESPDLTEFKGRLEGLVPAGGALAMHLGDEGGRPVVAFVSWEGGR